jgi:radical SAM protein with 4Fe4S-binding SPASM domain
MTLNELSNLGLKTDYETALNNRAKLDTGTQCNYKCNFCYYIDHLDVVTEFDVIKDRIDYLVECGISEVDLSGGESSIHKDWFTILDYCTSKNLKISTLSNGYKFADKEFLRKSKEHGLEEILFSLHGYDEQSHNKMVNHKKGFSNIIQAIKNANELDIVVRINCTVQHDNYLHLKEYVNLLNHFDILEVNFLTLNYWSDASGLKTIDYNEITPKIQEAIDLLDVKYKNVRYTPYCFMIGYERYVCNYYQHVYDKYDWNIAVYDYKIDPREYKSNKHKSLYSKAKYNRNKTYYKKEECKECKYFYICDGIEKQLDIELHPVHGEKIHDVNYFRKGFYETVDTCTNT